MNNDWQKNCRRHSPTHIQVQQSYSSESLSCSSLSMPIFSMRALSAPSMVLMIIGASASR